MSNIKLVYFEGCPEAKNIRAALLNARVYDFEVILQNKLLENDPYRKLSSPSVLKDQELIYGMRTDGHISTCTFDSINRVDETPLVERFKGLLESKKSTAEGSISFIGSAFSMLLALKCPACIPALVALLSTLGLSFLISQAVLKSALIIMLLLSMGGLFYSYHRHKNFLPLALGSIFSLALYVGRFHHIGQFNQLVTYTAVSGLILTTLWDYRLRSKKHCKSCL